MLITKRFSKSMWKISDGVVSIRTDSLTDIGFPMPTTKTADITTSKLIRQSF